MNISVQDQADLYHIIQQLMDTQDFKNGLGYTEKNGSARENIYSWTANHQAWCSQNDIEIFFGATRVVIVPVDIDWVIKVDFDMTTHPTADDFEKAFSYCQREADNYADAVKANLGDFFAETYFFGTYNGIKFFIQEKATCSSDEIEDILYNACANNTAFDPNDYCEEYNQDEIEDLRNSYIWDEMSNLDDDERWNILFSDRDDRLDELDIFINNHSINDLHCGNYGETDHGYVFTDFSGYGYDLCHPCVQ